MYVCLKVLLHVCMYGSIWYDATIVFAQQGETHLLIHYEHVGRLSACVI